MAMHDDIEAEQLNEGNQEPRNSSGNGTVLGGYHVGSQFSLVRRISKTAMVAAKMAVTSPSVSKLL